MSILERFRAPTPRFFRVLRNVGMGVAAAGGALTAWPELLAPETIKLGGYLMVGGSVLTAVAQSVVEH
jgi:hypothetical protein